MQRQKHGQRGRKYVIKIGGTGVDAHATHRLLTNAGRPLGIFHIGEDARRAFIEGAALGCELELARRTIEQPRSKPRLQPCDQFADGRGRHARDTCGGREATLFDHTDKHFHLAGSVGFNTRHDDFIS